MTVAPLALLALLPAPAGAQCSGGSAGGVTLAHGLEALYVRERCEVPRLRILVLWRLGTDWRERGDSLDGEENPPEWRQEIFEEFKEAGYGMGGSGNSDYQMGVAWNQKEGRIKVFYGDTYPVLTIVEDLRIDSDSLHVLLVDGGGGRGEGPEIMGRRTLPPATGDGLRPPRELREREELEEWFRSEYDPDARVREIVAPWPEALRFLSSDSPGGASQ